MGNGRRRPRGSCSRCRRVRRPRRRRLRRRARPAARRRPRARIRQQLHWHEDPADRFAPSPRRDARQRLAARASRGQRARPAFELQAGLRTPSTAKPWHSTEAGRDRPERPHGSGPGPAEAPRSAASCKAPVLARLLDCSPQFPDAPQARHVCRLEHRRRGFTPPFAPLPVSGSGDELSRRGATERGLDANRAQPPRPNRLRGAKHHFLARAAQFDPRGFHKCLGAALPRLHEQRDLQGV